MDRILSVPFNHQQLALLDRYTAAPGAYSALILQALAQAQPGCQQAQLSPPAPPPPKRRQLTQHLLEPGTGIAVEVKAGQVLRIAQVEGGQCGDLNVYNLQNGQEHLHVGRTRHLHGPHPTTGDLLWSCAPWERPLMAILQNTGVCDTTFASCSTLGYSHFYNMPQHINCQQMQIEAQRAYGIGPWQEHDSFNLFMYTVSDSEGNPGIDRNGAGPGDYIEFYALTDVLTIPNVCGDDLGKTSNFWQNHLSVIVEEALPEDRKRAADFIEPYKNSVVPVPYQMKEVPLHRDPDYTPHFPHLPLHVQQVEVVLSEQDQQKLDAVRNPGLYGDDLCAALRDIVMDWADAKNNASLPGYNHH